MAVLHRFYCTHNAVGWSAVCDCGYIHLLFGEQICLQNYLPDRYPRIKCISDFFYLGLKVYMLWILRKKMNESIVYPHLLSGGLNILLGFINRKGHNILYYLYLS